MVRMVHFTQRCINITQDPHHPLHSIFTLMPPGRRFQSLQPPLHQTIGQLCAPGCQQDEWFPSPHCEDVTLSASPYTNGLYLNSLCTAIISYTIIVLGHQHHTYSYTVYSLIHYDFKMSIFIYLYFYVLTYLEGRLFRVSVCLNIKKFDCKIPWVLDITILSKYFGPFWFINNLRGAASESTCLVFLEMIVGSNYYYLICIWFSSHFHTRYVMLLYVCLLHDIRTLTLHHIAKVLI